MNSFRAYLFRSWPAGIVLGLAFVATLMAVITVAVSCRFHAPPTTIECAADGDCEQGEVCAEGQCVAGDSSDALVECTADDDCVAGEVCSEGVCVMAGTLVPGDDASPEPTSEPGGSESCEADADCAVDESCVDGVCTISAAPTPASRTPCEDDAGCLDFESCEDGFCMAECEIDAECDDGVFCNGFEACLSNICSPGEYPCDPDTDVCNELDDVCQAPDNDNPVLRIKLTVHRDTVYGTDHDETVVAEMFSYAGLSDGDYVNMLGGTDRIEVDIKGRDYLGVATVKNIEHFYFRNIEPNVGHSFSFRGISDASDVWSTGSLGSLTLHGFEYLVRFHLVDSTQELIGEFDDTAVEGGDDQVTVSLENAQAGTAIKLQSDGSHGVERVVLVSEGDSANRVDSLIDGGENELHTVHVTGDADLRLVSLDANIRQIDASSFGGSLDVNLAGLIYPISAVLSPQNDVVRLDQLMLTDQINGGAGADTLVLAGPLINAGITGIETLEIANASAAIAYDLTAYPEMTTSIVRNTSSIFGQFTVTGMPAAGTLALHSDVDYTLTSTSTMTLANDAGVSDAATLKLYGAGIAAFNAQIDAGFIETLTINGLTPQVTFNTAACFDRHARNVLKTIALTGSAPFVLNNTLAGGSLQQLNAASQTGGVTMYSPASTAALTISGGSGHDRLQGGGAADNISGGAGNDTLVGGAGADVLAGGADQDTFVFTGPGDGADTINGFAAADALDLTAFASADAPLAEVADTSVGDAPFANGDVLLVADADGSIGAPADIAALFGGGGRAFEAISPAENVVVVVRDSQPGGGTTVWFVANDGDAAVAAGEATLVATLSAYNTVIGDAQIVD